MKQSNNELERFSSQIRFALENYTPHGIDKNSLNAVLICGTGGSGVAGRIVKDYFQDKLDLPVAPVAGYLLPRYAGPHSLVIVWSYSGEQEEALTQYDIARERGCRLIVITSGGRLSEKARADEVIIYPVEATSEMALGYALGYQFQIIFELLGVYKKPDLVKIADNLGNVHDYRQRSAELAGLFQETRKQKFIVVCDSFFEGAARRFCQQINQAGGTEAFFRVLPGDGYEQPESYHSRPGNNYIFLNSRLSHPLNLRFSAVKDQLEKKGIKPLELLVMDASLDSLFHVVHLLDWLALQVNGMGAPALAAQ